MPALSDSQLLTVGDVAERLRISRRKVWAMLRTSTFPKPVTIGRRGTRWRAVEVDTYITKLSR